MEDNQILRLEPRRSRRSHIYPALRAWEVRLERQPNKAFDAIVIGSGPAGSTIARELSKRKMRVLILERGGDGLLKEGLGMAPILNTVSVSDNLDTVRACTTGGTTAIYFGVADPPPLETFLSLGIDISRELAEAKKELPLTVLPDELLGAQALRIRESATSLGYPCEKSTMLVDLSKCTSGYAYDAKWNARSYLHEAVAEGATLITQASVLRVLVDRGRAIGVEYKLQKKKRVLELCQAFATKIILAAGGAASPTILRNSGIKSVLNSGFYCHPGFVVFGTIRGLKAGDNFIGSTGTVVDGDISVGDGNPARAFYRMLMLSNRRLVRAFFHSSSIGVGVIVNDGLAGGLQENGRYYKKLQKEELGKLARGEEVARQIVRHAGGKGLFKAAPSASHIGGAIRIREHIDEYLETEYRNLHVCDGSVIPGNVRISPTLTLICLGKYLARHLTRAL